MEFNRVNVISHDNKIDVFIDGVKVKGLLYVNIKREVDDPKTVLELKLKCNLDTKEQPIKKAVQSID